MRQTLDERIITISNLLLENSFVDLDMMLNQLHISKRTVYYVVQEINKLFKSHDLPMIQSQYGKGMFLTKEQVEFLTDYLNKEIKYPIILDTDERIATVYLLVLLSSKKYYIKDLEGLFDVSRFTINTDINKLKNILHKFEVKFISQKNGYIVQGNEINIRKAFFYLFSNIYLLVESERFQNIIKNEFKFDEILHIVKYFRNLEEKYNIKYSDISLWGIACMIFRANHREDVMHEFTNEIGREENIIKDSKEFKEICKYFDGLNNYDIVYFSVLLYCSKLDACMYSNYNTQELTTELINTVSAITGINIVDYDLYEKLSRHLEVAYVRYKYGIFNENPLLSSIRERFPDYFNIIKQATIAMRNKFGGLVTNDEIGFLTLYFVGVFNKYFSGKKIRIYIVCLNGTATSYLLKNELLQIDHRIEVVDTISEKQLSSINNDDLIVSTIKLDSKFNHIIVHPIPTIEDKLKVIEYLNGNGIYYKYPTMKDILLKIQPYLKDGTNELVRRDLMNLYHDSNLLNSNNNIFKINFVNIMLNDKETTWQTLISLAAEPLIKEKYINDLYVKEVIQNIEDYGSYMVYPNGYILAHASTDNSQKLGLSILLLKNEIEIYGNMVSKIFMITPNNHTSHLQILNNLLVLFKMENIDHMYENFNQKMLFDFLEKVIFQT